MKKYFLGVVAIALALGFSAFTTKKLPPNPTFYFNPADGVVALNALTDAQVSNAASWGSTVVSLGSIAKLGAVEVAIEAVEDGPNDGQITKDELMDILAAEFNESTDVFTSYDFTVGTGTPTRIQIYKRQN